MQHISKVVSGLMSNRINPTQTGAPIALGDIAPLLQWFTESEIKTLLGSVMTQQEINLYVSGCQRCTARGVESFKQYLWREYYAAHREIK